MPTKRDFVEFVGPPVGVARTEGYLEVSLYLSPATIQNGNEYKLQLQLVTTD